MPVSRIATLSMLALLAATLLSSAAQAEQGWQFGLRLPRIYLPEVTGNWDDEDYYDEEVYVEPRRRARGNMVYDPELDEWVPRKRLKQVRRQMVYDQYLDEWVPVERMRRASFDEDFEPVFEIDKPAKKKSKKKTIKTATVAKKPFVVKPLDINAAPRKTNANLALASPVTPKVIKPKVQSETKTASIAKPVTTPAAKPAKPAIGCSNAADIVAGYGFSGVKPKSCTGANYTFNAARAEKAYVITLSSATGEITDVKKVN